MYVKYVIIIFLCTLTILYYLSYSLIVLDYVKINHIYIQKSIDLWTNKYGNKSRTKFIADLGKNNTCQINILNTNIILNYISDIENNNQVYYTFIENPTNIKQHENKQHENQINLCSRPQTFKSIVFEKIIIYIFMCIISLYLSVLLLHISVEFYEYRKECYIKEQDEYNENKEHYNYIEKKINWIEYI